MDNASNIGKTCPYCMAPLKPNDTVAQCPVCKTPHHAECWQENGGCTTYGCAGAHAATPAAAAATVTRPRVPQDSIVMVACPRCGTMLDSPTTPCPHCSRRTPSVPARPRWSSEIPSLTTQNYIGLGIFVFFLIAMGLSSLWPHADNSPTVTPPPAPPSYPSPPIPPSYTSPPIPPAYTPPAGYSSSGMRFPVPVAPQDVGTVAGFQISDIQMDVSDYGNVCIGGNARNTNNFNCLNVKIIFKLYDAKGRYVGTAMDFVSEVPSGGDLHIMALASTSEAVTCKFSSLHYLHR